jgi:hypothetical protein
MRSIIRFSVDGEQNGLLRNRLADVLKQSGYVLNPHVTATWEHANIAPADLAAVMRGFWQEASNPPNAATVDHVWMYSDNPP